MKKTLITILCILLISQKNQAIVVSVDSEARVTNNEAKEFIKYVDESFKKLDQKIVEKTHERLRLVKPLESEEVE